MYQCADITLVDNYVQTETYTCANVTASTQTRGNQQSSGVSESVASATAAVAATGKLAGEDQPVSPVRLVSALLFLSVSVLTIRVNSQVGAGFIGAAVALVLCAVVVAGAYFAGVAKFGSRSKLAAASAAHHQDTIPAYAQDNGSMISRGSMVKA